LKLNNVNGCNDISFGDHSILEGDRIPPLKSHGQALEEELCFPGVLSDNRDAPANLLCHLLLLLLLFIVPKVLHSQGTWKLAKCSVCVRNGYDGDSEIVSYYYYYYYC